MGTDSGERPLYEDPSIEDVEDLDIGSYVEIADSEDGQENGNDKKNQ